MPTPPRWISTGILLIAGFSGLAWLMTGSSRSNDLDLDAPPPAESLNSVQRSLILLEDKLNLLTSRIAAQPRARRPVVPPPTETAEPPRRREDLGERRLGLGGRKLQPKNEEERQELLGRMLERRARTLGRDLGLTPEQEAGMVEILQTQHSRFQDFIKGVREGTIRTREERNEAIGEMREERLDSVQRILTDTQFQAYRQRLGAGGDAR